MAALRPHSQAVRHLGKKIPAPAKSNQNVGREKEAGAVIIEFLQQLTPINYRPVGVIEVYSETYINDQPKEKGHRISKARANVLVEDKRHHKIHLLQQAK